MKSMSDTTSLLGTRTISSRFTEFVSFLFCELVLTIGHTKAVYFILVVTFLFPSQMILILIL